MKGKKTTSRQTETQTDGQTDRQTDRPKDGRINRPTDGQKDRPTDGQTDRQTDITSFYQLQFLRYLLQENDNRSFCYPLLPVVQGAIDIHLMK